VAGSHRIDADAVRDATDVALAALEDTATDAAQWQAYARKAFFPRGVIPQNTGPNSKQVVAQVRDILAGRPSTTPTWRDSRR
jgi:hypothetical protein